MNLRALIRAEEVKKTKKVLKLNLEIESPCVVVPRSSSSQVQLNQSLIFIIIAELFVRMLWSQTLET